MKKVIIIFAGVALALVSCKTNTDGLASSSVDDVYYNPAKDRKPNVPPQPEQYAAKTADPNAGKIAATEADNNNPYYRDPNFNYDDYYDDAYAARIRRFNNPIYGTGYYDSYNTNSYFYNGNPSCYGSSIYNNYGYNNNYYSPSANFWNSYYNPYYSGYGNGLSIGYGVGYGYGNPYSMCNMGYGMGGYNPYMGYGSGGMYNPYAYGMGYSPYGYSPYGYSPYGNFGYNGGFGGYPYGGYSNPYGGGYYNSYDYNSNSYSNYGPRTNHTGGNSTTTSPVTGPSRLTVNKPDITGPGSADPYNEQRFTHVTLPKEHFNYIQAVKNPVSSSTMSAPVLNQPDGGGRPIYNSGNNNGGSYNGGNSNPTYNNTYNGGGTYNGVKNNPVYTDTPRTINNNGGENPSGGEGKPKKWFSGGSDNSGGTNNGGNSPVKFNGGSSNDGGGGRPINNNNGGGGNNNSNGGGGVQRPRK